MFKEIDQSTVYSDIGFKNQSSRSYYDFYGPLLGFLRNSDLSSRIFSCPASKKDKSLSALSPVHDFLTGSKKTTLEE